MSLFLFLMLIVSFAFISALIFKISFLLPTLGFSISSFSSCFRCESEREVAQSCPTLCNPMNCSLSSSSVHGIFQARVLDWIAISFSRGFSQPRNQTRVSHTADRCFTIWATSFRCRVKLFIWLFSCFLRYACIAINFPLNTAFIVSYRFWVVVFSFAFISMHILISFFISSVICWLFSSVLFSLHILEFLTVFLL